MPISRALLSSPTLNLLYCRKCRNKCKNNISTTVSVAERKLKNTPRDEAKIAHRFRGREHPLRWRERLGRPSAPRPTGRLIWFHAVSLGEGLAAIPVIKCCLERRPDVTVLMTTTTTSAFEVIKNRLPSKVIYQFAPLDIPSTMDAFLHYWRPNAVMLMESELWPNLIMSAARNGNHSKLVSSSNSSIDHIDAIKIFIDSPIAITDSDISEGDEKSLEEFQVQLSHRKVWMASSIHKGEEEGAHNVLKQKHADIVTIIVPRQPQHGREIALYRLVCYYIGLVDSELIMCFGSNDQKLKEEGTCVALRSRGDNPTPETSLYVVDSLGELRDFYRVAPIAVIGGSFLLGSAGHNISEAAAAGCAVLTGHHVGHFSHMVAEMQQVNPLSVLQNSGRKLLKQVSGEKLVEAVNELFSNVEILEARRAAARQAYCALSSGIIENVWEMLHFHVFLKSVIRDDCHGVLSCIDVILRMKTMIVRTNNTYGTPGIKVAKGKVKGYCDILVTADRT
ncbi:hypothetical protein DH2020_026186 [Rehmannia glutinosa]|uniref:3-deoxy-D-manno-octulosonic-acid transferase N-terminal domain-containing protein n=1 Tax=Rehmannia glutinosa TaxID=99300 RepID=A0ABR0W0I3_REHGL